MDIFYIDLRKPDFTKYGGGLCSKLYCLFSACEMTIKYNIPLLEPEFGWKTKCYFSEIYDIDYFNNYMKKYNKNRNIMVPIKYKYLYSISNPKSINSVTLWKFSEHRLRNFREKSKIPNSSMMIKVLGGLRLNTTLNNIKKYIYKKTSTINGIHLRIENDWKIYSSTVKNINNKEKILTDIDSIINLYKNKWNTENVFFTTGANHNKIADKFKNEGIISNCYFNKNLEYEMNAAINFYIMIECKNFIGLSRSMFSNLITLQRSLIGKKSFIYNYNNSINERIDKGLYPEGKESITRTVVIFDS